MLNFCLPPAPLLPRYPLTGESDLAQRAVSFLKQLPRPPQSQKSAKAVRSCFAWPGGKAFSSHNLNTVQLLALPAQTFPACSARRCAQSPCGGLLRLAESSATNYRRKLRYVRPVRVSRVYSAQKTAFEQGSSYCRLPTGSLQLVF